MGDHFTYDTSLCQIADSPMSAVGPGFVEVCPPEETTSPVTFSRLMVGNELVVVYRSIRLVQSIGACSTTVVG